MRDENIELRRLVDMIEEHDGSLACKGGIWRVEVSGMSWVLLNTKLTEACCARARNGITAAALDKVRRYQQAEEQQPDFIAEWNAWLSERGPRPPGIAPQWVLDDQRYYVVFAKEIR
jgi:hypothetical protein